MIAWHGDVDQGLRRETFDSEEHSLYLILCRRSVNFVASIFCALMTAWIVPLTKY